MKRTVALILGSLLVSLVLAELLVALFAPSTFVRTDILGRRIANRDRPDVRLADGFPEFVPNQRGRVKLLSSYDYDYVINSLGLRNREVSAGPFDGLRILVLGDSQTYGTGVAQDSTFSAHLERMLDDSLDIPVQVINAGVPGTGQVEQLRLLSRVVGPLQPDLVLIAVHLDNALVADEGNDLFNNAQRLRGTDAAPTAADVPNVRFLARHSHLYALLSRVRRRLSGVPTHLDVVARYAETQRDTPSHRAIWDSTRSLLAGMSALAADSAGAGTVLVYIPEMASLALNDSTAIRELELAGMPLISTFATLRAVHEVDPMLLRFRHDAHFNPRMHRLIAGTIVQGLLDWRALPRRSG